MSSTDISRVDVPATVQPDGQAIALPSDVSQAITQMAQIMQGMANMCAPPMSAWACWNSRCAC